MFSLTALVPWMFFANAFLLSSESLVLNQALISKIYFPRIFIPAGVIAAGCVDFTISLTILLAIVLIYGVVPSVAFLVVPVLVTIAIATVLGAGTALSAINVRYRDVRYIVPFATQMWLFVTPVVYPSSSLSEPLRILSALNPMTGVVEGFRWALLGSGSAPWDLIGISAGSAVVLLVMGLAYFDRVERSFADLIPEPMSYVAIQAEGLGKSYRLGLSAAYGSLRESITNAVRGFDPAAAPSAAAEAAVDVLAKRAARCSAL
ncbi:MAG: ABC transporter permease [Solirubrobacterales bacterium]